MIHRKTTFHSPSSSVLFRTKPNTKIKQKQNIQNTIVLFLLSILCAFSFLRLFEKNQSNAKEFENNPTLQKVVEPENDLKNFLVEYTGEKNDPEDKNVTVEMIIDTMAKEFPEFILAIAEENWIRGYHQALEDVETGRAAHEEAMAGDKQE